MSKGHLGSSVGKTVQRARVKAHFLRAAANMDAIADDGACIAITTTSRATENTVGPALDYFDKLYDPYSGKSYWFGRPQCQLRGKAAAKARQHRVYALLLAAESIE